MRLTPAEVHNVAFKKPSIGKRGYDEDEVDAFLDLVEDELAKLLEENTELKARLEAGGVEAPAPRPETIEPVAPEPVAALVKQAPPVQQAPAEVSTVDSHVHAARLLGLAQETADRLTSEASTEAANTLSSARAESERLLTAAQSESEQLRSAAAAEASRLQSEAAAEAERLRNDASSESERVRADAQSFSNEMLAEAHAKAEAAVSEATARAEALEADAKRKSESVLSGLVTQRTELERKIADLRTYEREYRSRLKSWITDQLQQLDGAPSESATVS